MPSYTNTFAGVTKDLTQATIQGADWDTEYSGISTQILLASNKVVSPTLGHLVEQSASGDTVTAAILSDNLDGIVSPVQAQIDWANPPQDTTDDYRASGAVHIKKGAVANTNTLDLIATVGGSYAVDRIGPTGAVGTAITWSALDDVPATATAIIVTYSSVATSNLKNGNTTHAVFGHLDPDATSGELGNLPVYTHTMDINSTSGAVSELLRNMIIPIDTSGRFYASLLLVSGTQSQTLTLRGYITNGTVT